MGAVGWIHTKWFRTETKIMMKALTSKFTDKSADNIFFGDVKDCAFESKWVQKCGLKHDPKTNVCYGNEARDVTLWPQVREGAIKALFPLPDVKYASQLYKVFQWD